MKLTHDDTIVAIATAAGGALRGILRMSGPEAAQVLLRLGTFDPPLDSTRRPTLLQGVIELSLGLGIVPATVYWWPTNKSYTREPCAELHLIGSPPILAAALEAACSAGARLAAPGEFTLRAFLAGRLDLTQAEAVLGVVDAESHRQLDIALAQLAGGLALPLTRLRESMLDLVAHLEAGLDFVEEDIEFIGREALIAQVDAMGQQIAAIAGQLRERGGDGERARVVLYGRANAGKSSLLNVLAGEDAALVSPIAGTTRDFVTRDARFSQRSCVLIDTAGIVAETAINHLDDAMQVATGRQAQAADLKILCLDRSLELTNWESDELARNDDRRLVVWTKCDLGPHIDASSDIGIATSSHSGVGIQELKTAIVAALDSSDVESGSIAATADRCRESLRLAAESLLRASETARGSCGDELVAAELRLALEELGRIVGAVYTEDILDRVFSRFCIGK